MQKNVKRIATHGLGYFNIRRHISLSSTAVYQGFSLAHAAIGYRYTSLSRLHGFMANYTPGSKSDCEAD
jgi:hypothetical protein